MRLLANPVLLRAATVFVCSMFFFMLGLFFVRSLRKNIEEESEISDGPSRSLEALPLNLYNTVIQQLKQQKHELQVQSQVDQSRARISENFSQAVLSNLSCGVLVFGANGLVKTSNPGSEIDPRIWFNERNERRRHFQGCSGPVASTRSYLARRFG